MQNGDAVMFGEVSVTVTLAGAFRPSTTLRAEAPTRSLRFEIAEESFFSAIGTMLGSADLWVRDDRIDDRYVFRTNNSTLLEYLLTREVKDALHELRAYHFQGRGDEIMAQRPGEEGDEKQLAKAIEVVSRLAAGLRGLDTKWEALVDALGGSLSERDRPRDPQYHFFEKMISLHRGVPITIDVLQFLEGDYRVPTCLAVKLRAQVPCERFLIWSVSDPDPDEDQELAKVTEFVWPNERPVHVLSKDTKRTAARLASVAPLIYPGIHISAFSGNVVLFAKRFTLDRDELERDVSILSRLLHTTNGPYR